MNPSFWGSQGRIARLTAGPWSGRFAFVYPDTREPWWTVVIDPGPVPGVPGDMYIDNTSYIEKIIDEWGFVWVALGKEEFELEREHFGWRPLQGKSWL